MRGDIPPRRNGEVSMRRSVISALLTLGLFAGVAPVAEAQAQDPYVEGPVVVVSRLRTEPGQGPAYLRYIFGDYARLMTAYKEAGIILDWGVLSVQPRTPEDPDLILTTTYANMAALDGLPEKTRPIVQKVMGMNTEQSARASAERQAMRKQIGSDLMRRLQPR
jgi:hypothetical protein